MRVLKIDVRLFASHRERAGRAHVVLDMQDGSTVGDLIDALLEAHPEISTEPSRLVAAVNQEYRERDFALSDGDEVALIPPVSGGSSDRRARQI